MSEPPADTLRRAAEKLRGLADAATPGPWHGWAKRDDLLNVCTHSGCHVPGATEDPSGNPTVDYITAVHPGVALLIADWLDAEAAAHEGGMATSEGVCKVLAAVGAGEHTIQVAVSTLDQALAVARTILGEDGAR